MRFPVVAGRDFRVMKSHIRNQNNFDIIRLLAAVQVVFVHAYEHKVAPQGQVLLEGICAFVKLFPGVPIFFVISGFLISMSFESNQRQIKPYFWNRFLRIYPALWVCFAFTVIQIGVFGFLDRGWVGSLNFWGWIAGQTTMGQFVNPEHLRSFGVGVTNGALWTIPVELQFYLVLPVIFGALAWSACSTKRGNLLIAVLMAGSYAGFLLNAAHPKESLVWKLFGVSIIPHLWMFLVGVLIHQNFSSWRRFLEGHAARWSLAFLPLVVLEQFCADTKWHAGVFLVTRLVMGFWTIAVAFTAGGIAHRLLRGNDISYGVYIYHMLLVNTMLHLGVRESMPAFLLIFPLTMALAFGSWRLVEKPALRLKNRFQWSAVQSGGSQRPQTA